MKGITKVDIVEFTTYSDKSPCIGFGVWIVLEKHDGKAHLLHPVHLCELNVREYEFRSSIGKTLWPINSTGASFNANRFITSFKNRIAFFLENERAFPVQAVAKALAEFEEISMKEALAFIGKSSVDELGNSISIVSNKTTREYAIREGLDISIFKGRQLSILEALRDNGPASIYSITSLVDKTLKTKTDKNRVVTYFVNKLASQGILEIV